MTNIFVGNLSYQTTQDELFTAFSAYGNVERVSIVTDRDSGQPRGFAFVEMTEARDAEAAIAQLNGAATKRPCTKRKRSSSEGRGRRRRRSRIGLGGGRGGNRGGGGGGRGQRW